MKSFKKEKKFDNIFFIFILLSLVPFFDKIHPILTKMFNVKIFTRFNHPAINILPFVVLSQNYNMLISAFPTFIFLFIYGTYDSFLISKMKFCFQENNQHYECGMGRE